MTDRTPIVVAFDGTPMIAIGFGPTVWTINGDGTDQFDNTTKRDLAILRAMLDHASAQLDQIIDRPDLIPLRGQP